MMNSRKKTNRSDQRASSKRKKIVTRTTKTRRTNNNNNNSKSRKNNNNTKKNHSTVPIVSPISSPVNNTTTNNNNNTTNPFDSNKNDNDPPIPQNNSKNEDDSYQGDNEKEENVIFTQSLDDDWWKDPKDIITTSTTTKSTTKTTNDKDLNLTSRPLSQQFNPSNPFESDDIHTTVIPYSPTTVVQADARSDDNNNMNSMNTKDNALRSKSKRCEDNASTNPFWEESNDATTIPTTTTTNNVNEDKASTNPFSEQESDDNASALPTTTTTPVNDVNDTNDDNNNDSNEATDADDNVEWWNGQEETEGKAKRSEDNAPTNPFLEQESDDNVAAAKPSSTTTNNVNDDTNEAADANDNTEWWNGQEETEGQVDARNNNNMNAKDKDDRPQNKRNEDNAPTNPFLEQESDDATPTTTTPVNDVSDTDNNNNDINESTDADHNVEWWNGQDDVPNTTSSSSSTTTQQPTPKSPISSNPPTTTQQEEAHPSSPPQFHDTNPFDAHEKEEKMEELNNHTTNTSPLPHTSSDTTVDNTGNKSEDEDEPPSATTDRMDVSKGILLMNPNLNIDRERSTDNDDTMTTIRKNTSSPSSNKLIEKDTEALQVYLRLRPMNKLEMSRRSYNCMQVQERQEIDVMSSMVKGSTPLTASYDQTVLVESPTAGEYEFRFDQIFDKDASQSTVYEQVASPMAKKLLQGYNCALIVYGQSGSGKSLSMIGSGSSSTSSPTNGEADSNKKQDNRSLVQDGHDDDSNDSNNNSNNPSQEEGHEDGTTINQSGSGAGDENEFTGSRMSTPSEIAPKNSTYNHGSIATSRGHQKKKSHGRNTKSDQKKENQGQSNSGTTTPTLSDGSKSPSTHLEGQSDNDSFNNDDGDGIIPRMVKDIFKIMKDSPPTMLYTIRVSFLEIFLEQIRDLLNPSNDSLSLVIHDDDDNDIIDATTSNDTMSQPMRVQGLSEICCVHESEVLSLLLRGNAYRILSEQKKQTDLKVSHSIFNIHVEQKDMTTGHRTVSQLQLVDMAGSELLRAGVTSSGKRLFPSPTHGSDTEVAAHHHHPVMLRHQKEIIHRSQSALINVVRALTRTNSVYKGSSSTPSQQPIATSKKVPYRKSKLTRILKEAFGGNCHTKILVTATPASFNITESIESMKFAQMVRRIQNVPTVNVIRSPREYKLELEESKKRESELRKVLQVITEDIHQMNLESKSNEDQDNSSNFLLDRIRDTLDKNQSFIAGKTNVSSTLEHLQSNSQYKDSTHQPDDNSDSNDTTNIAYDPSIQTELRRRDEEISTLKKRLSEATKSRDNAQHLVREIQAECSALRQENDIILGAKKANVEELIDAHNQINQLSQHRIEMEHNLRTSQFRDNEATVFLRHFRRFYQNLLQTKSAQGSGSSIEEILSSDSSKMTHLIDVDAMLIQSGFIEDDEVGGKSNGPSNAPSVKALIRSSTASRIAHNEMKRLEKLDELKVLRSNDTNLQDEQDHNELNANSHSKISTTSESTSGVNVSPKAIEHDTQQLKTPSGRLTQNRIATLERDLNELSRKCIEIQIASMQQEELISTITSRNRTAMAKKQLAEETLKLRHQLEEKEQDLDIMKWKVNELDFVNKTFFENQQKAEQHIAYLEESLLDSQGKNSAMFIKQQESERKLRRQIAHLNSLIDALTKPLWQYGEESGKRSLESRTIIPIQGRKISSKEKSSLNASPEDTSSVEVEERSSDEDEEDQFQVSWVDHSTSSSKDGMKIYPVDEPSSRRGIHKELLPPSSLLPPRRSPISKQKTSTFSSQEQQSEVELITGELETIPLARASKNQVTSSFRPETSTTHLSGISMSTENAPSIDSSIFVDKTYNMDKNNYSLTSLETPPTKNKESLFVIDK